MSEPIFKVSTPAKKQIARAFGLKANYYDSNAVVQKELLSRLKLRITNQPESLWVDLGCGTGYFEHITCNSFLPGRFVGIDIALESLIHFQARQISGATAVNADIENLPFKQSSIDGVVIASVLQWFNDPSIVLKKISGILKKNGTFLFASFIKGSFLELNLLKQEWGLEIPIHLQDPIVLCNLITENNFNLVETEVYTKTIYFPFAFDLLKSISAIGGTAIQGNRLSPKKLLKFCNDYQKRFQTNKGVPITYNALIGSAYKGVKQ